MRSQLKATSLRQRVVASLLFIVGALSATAVQAETGLPTQFTVKYVLSKGSITLGEMSRKLYTNEAGNYVYESHSKPTGYARWFTDSVLLERSEWTYHNNYLRPLNYSYDRSGEKKKRNVKLSFDWQKLRVTNTINNSPWKMTIPENALDKLLYHLALMRDMELGGETLHYQVADGGKLKTYQFEILGEEILSTALGPLKTIKLFRPGKRATTLWCAKDYNYIPVRIKQDDKGIELVMTLSELTGIPKKQAKSALNTSTAP